MPINNKIWKEVLSMSWALFVAYAMQAVGSGTIIGYAIRDLGHIFGIW